MELHSRCETDDLGCQRKWRRWRGDSLSLLLWKFRFHPPLLALGIMRNVCVAQRNKTTAGRIVPSYLLTNYSGGLCGDCSQLLRFRNSGVHTP